MDFKLINFLFKAISIFFKPIARYFVVLLLLLSSCKTKFSWFYLTKISHDIKLTNQRWNFISIFVDFYFEGNMDHEAANGADFMGGSPIEMSNPVNGLSSQGISPFPYFNMFPFYRVCHRFWLTKRDDYFWVDFDHIRIEQYFWRQLGQYWKLAWA